MLRRGFVSKVRRKLIQPPTTLFGAVALRAVPHDEGANDFRELLSLRLLRGCPRSAGAQDDERQDGTCRPMVTYSLQDHDIPFFCLSAL
jgi:hypothetical protein